MSVWANRKLQGSPKIRYRKESQQSFIKPVSLTLSFQTRIFQRDLFFHAQLRYVVGFGRRQLRKVQSQRASAYERGIWSSCTGKIDKKRSEGC